MNCGVALEMRCPNCGTLVSAQAKFCTHCGQQLGGAAARSSDSSRPQAPGEATLSDLQKYIPKDLLSKFESAKASGGMQGERRIVTILFCDIVGSTAAAVHMDPEDWTEIVNRAFEYLIAPIYRYEGMVARLMGDAILAFFGAPIAHEDDPERAVLAGLEILEGIGEFNEAIKLEFGLDLDVRIGINTGQVVIGEVGSDLRVEYTAMGDAVNLAARMEQTAQPGSLQISDHTYKLIAPLFRVKDIGEVQVKGREQPVQAYQVIGRKEDPGRLRGIEGLETPLLGREADLKTLQQIMLGLSQSKGHIVSLIGEAGLGKTRLVTELRHSPLPDGEEFKDFIWLEGRSLSYEKSIPFQIFRYLINDYIGTPASQSDEERYARLAHQIRQLAPDEDAQITPFIGTVLGLPLKGPDAEAIHKLEPQQLQDSIFLAIRSLIQHLAIQKPLVLVFDDLHWADATSLLLLERLAPLTDQTALVIIALFRPDRREDSWKFHEFAEREFDYGYTAVSLSPLSATSSRDLVVRLLQAADLPEKVTNLILRKAEGNPFFIEEVIRSLVDVGMNERAALQGFVADEIQEINIPDTLAGVLTTRLDQLGEGPKRILQSAAVIGREFRYDTLRGITLNGEVLEESLIELIRRGQIREMSRIPQRLYAFNHVLTQEAAYTSLLRRDRRTIHMRIAEWWVGQDPDQVHTIAQHFLAAGSQARALPYLVEAGERAAHAYAIEEAFALYSQASKIVDSSGDPSQVCRIYGGLGEVLNWMGRHSEAVDAYRAMLYAAEADGDVTAQAAAWHGIAEAQMQWGEPRAALESAQREEGVARQARLELPLAKALWMKAWGLFMLGQAAEALEIAHEVASLSGQVGDTGQMAHSLNLLGVLYTTTGHYTEAANQFEKALDIFRSMGNRRRAMPLLNNLGVIAESRGDYRMAFERYQEALEIAREIGNRNGEAVYLSNLGGAKVRLGDFQSAEGDLRQVIDLAGEAGSYVLSSTYSHLAEASLAQQKGSEALLYARQALDLGINNESQDDIGLAWRVLGLVAAQAGGFISLENADKDGHTDYSAAACFARSDEIFNEIGREEERARTMRLWAKFELTSGDRSAGMARWQEAKRIFERLGAELEVQAMEDFPPELHG